ncbi:putative carbonic anhydrase 3 isoform X2 [Calliopsis andreniformis]|uniref:putative carbonic anhydrase 3 isoform X2 n=1 Tax=Calliopsis andreniformis TaxID=337506 RepID=UPI003FCEBA7E
MDLKYFILLLIFIHSGLHAVISTGDWTYSGEHGPAHWPGLCTTGSKQSPINIVTENTVKINLGALKFVRYDFAFPGKVTNNGHSVQIQLTDAPIQLKGGNLSSVYVLEQMHFHWPAEHTVDNNRDVLELHFVHYNIKYDNASVASQHENGIAVVSTLFELGNEDNLDIKPVLEATELVSKWTNTNAVTMKSKVIPYYFLPKDHTAYYRYYGSLTTPGCQESVTWSIFTNKLTISKQQLNIFENIGTSGGILSFNYRPIQPLGKRKVYHHDEYSGASIQASSLFCILFSFMLIKSLQLQ